MGVPRVPEGTRLLLQLEGVLILGDPTHQRGAPNKPGPQEYVFPQAKASEAQGMKDDLTGCLRPPPPDPMGGKCSLHSGHT